MAIREEFGFGTSFPTSNLEDNRYFYRTDFDALFVYDSTQATPGWRVAVTNVGDVINGDYLKVNDNGFVELVGGAIVWEDYRVTVNQVRVPASDFPSWANYSAGQVLAFAAQEVEANEEEVFLVIQVPHNYKEGTNIIPHIHVVPETEDAATFRFGLEYEWINRSASFSATSFVYAEQVINGNADDHLLVDFSEITGTGKTISSMLLCRLYRNSSHENDNFDDNVYFLEFDIHYQIDSFGSKTATVK